MATTINRAEPESQPPDPGAAQSSEEHRKKVILALCCIAQFMVILDLSIVNVALPSIQVGLKFSSADLQWVVNAYAIMFAGFLMLAGRGADVVGQRRTFLAALVVFSVASLAGGLSPTSTFLIVARGVQGIGGAMMAACSLAIITATFAPGAERRHAIALWGAMNGLGGAVGVLLSGVITQYASWRWVLLINVPIGIVTLLVAFRFIAEHRSPKRRSFDVPGALLLTVGQVLVAYGCVQAGIDGWGTAAAWIPIGIGAVLLALFPLAESRTSDPLVPVKTLTPQLKLINLIVVLFSASLFPMWYMGSLYLQQVLSLQPVTTGIAFLPMALMILFCASRAGRLVGRFGALPVLRAGLLFMTAGMALFSLIQSSGSAIQYIVLPGVLMTAGIGLSIVPSTIVATQSATAGQAGLASGLVNTSRQIGGGLGLAILVSIATSRTSALIGQNVTAPQALTSGFRLGYLIGAVLIAIALLLTFQLARVQRPAPAEQPQPAAERSPAAAARPATADSPVGRTRPWVADGPRAVMLAAVLVVVVFVGVALALPPSRTASRSARSRPRAPTRSSRRRTCIRRGSPVGPPPRAASSPATCCWPTSMT